MIITIVIELYIKTVFEGSGSGSVFILTVTEMSSWPHLFLPLVYSNITEYF